MTVTIPGGEAGFVTEKRRPPSVRTLPAAAASISSPCVIATPVDVDRRIRLGRRVPGGEGVGLGPDLDADVVHARRHRLGEPHAERAQAAREDRQLAGQLGPVAQRVGTADDRVGIVVGDHQPDRPGGGQEDRPEPVGRQVDPQPHAALEVTLLDQQTGRLGHPVGLGRQRQLDPLVGASWS